MELVKRQWLKWHLARSHKGDTTALSRLYRLQDPWGLKKPSEQFRFQETTRFIRERVGEHFGSILEIGCGEGLQTKYFAPLAVRIVGIDPSSRAIQRARAQGISNAVFEIGDLKSYETEARKSFNLVTACEVIYYFENLEFVYQSMSRLGQVCLATYYQGVSERLDRFFGTKAVNLETIRGVSCEWRVVWWANESIDRG